MSSLISRLWHSPRAWMVLSAMLTRGTGFLSSLLIARWAGTSALGVYSTTVNTASSVVQPALGVFSNAAALTSSDGVNALGIRALLRAFAVWALGGTLILAFVLSRMLLSMDDILTGAHTDVSHANVFYAGVAVMLGQLVLTSHVGLLAGAGRFLPMARLQSGLSVILMLLAWPAVAVWGLSGALWLAGAVACLPALATGLLAWQSRSLPVGVADKSAWQLSWQHLRAGAPNALALLLNAGVNWVCTIYLVQSARGHEGVAVVAVASQWLNLMLMPVTSWGGMVLKELIDAHGTGAAGSGVNWAVVRRLSVRNVGVTLALVAGVDLAASLISDAYRLRSAGLAPLLWTFGVVALSASVINVLERLYVCRGRQLDWAWLSSVGLLMQLAVTWFGVHEGLWMVCVGVLIANLTTACLAVLWMMRVSSTQRRAV